jgi:hypothetical protein
MKEKSNALIVHTTRIGRENRIISKNINKTTNQAVQSLQPPLPKKEGLRRFYLVRSATIGNNLEIDPFALNTNCPPGKLSIYFIKTKKAANLIIS